MSETDTDNLNKSLSTMTDKTRQLNDSLKALADEGFAALSRSLNNTGGSHGSGTQQAAGDIALQSLSKLLKQEVTDSIGQIFGTTATGGRAVGASAAGAINVIINNNTSAAVSTAETTDAFDQKTLEITIDQMVANSLLRGRQTSGVLRSLFGIVPSLIGR